jgi:adenylate cyclase
MSDAAPSERPTLVHRLVRRRLHALAGKSPREALGPEDWMAFYRHHTAARGATKLFRSLPHGPRCRLCGAPFAGAGSYVLGPLGYWPSRKNPHYCATCIEFAPPGGTAMNVGVMFADVRGFTRLARETDLHELTDLLRRFYAQAEAVLFPEALIDKLIGDAVMALYIPMLGRLEDPAQTMLDHARRLLSRIGYGTPDGPFLEVGIGMDFGEAFVGNIGDRWLWDFTAVGDVVNTAAKLQGQARGGEILMSDRLAATLREGAGQAAARSSDRAASTFSSCVSGFTRGKTWRTTPSGSIRNVERWMPM